jgi:hypothetical protein
VIGEGSFGKVYKATLWGQEVAVKELRLKGNQEVAMREFRKEVYYKHSRAILSKLEIMTHMISMTAPNRIEINLPIPSL